MSESVTRSLLSVRKVRTKGPIDSSVPSSKGFDASGQPFGTPFGGGSITSFNQAEQIVYSTKPKKLRHQSNRCLHTRHTFGYGESPLQYRKVMNLAPGFTGYYTEYYNGHIHAATAHGQALTAALASIPGNTGTGYLGVNAQQLMNDAWIRVKPDLKVVSLPNFFLEIGEIKTLGRFWDAKKSKARNVAGGGLQYSFGAKPLIGDVTSILDAVVNLKARLDSFTAMAYQPQSKRISVPIESYTGSGTFNYDNPIGYTNPCSWRVVVNRHAQVHIKFLPKPILALNNLSKYLNGALASLGIELNPRIVWDAIPFSFLVDWFVDVGGFLDAHKISALELPVELLDGCVQYKETISVESRLRLDVGHVGVSSESSWPGVADQFQHFERMPIMPDYGTLRAIDVHWPTLKQAELGLLLGIANSGTTDVKRFHHVNLRPTSKLGFFPESAFTSNRDF